MAVFLAAVTLASGLAVGLGLRLEPNIAALLPDRGEAAALRRYARAFGGADLSVVAVEGPDPEENAKVSAEVAEELSKRPSVKRAADHADLSRPVDPMIAFGWADEAALARMREALTPEGMRVRLKEARGLLLAPGSGSLAGLLAEDPLRLSQLAFSRASFGGGMRVGTGGDFANETGTMRLVLVQPVGQALRGADAKAFVNDATAVIEPIARAHPTVKVGLTGGHAVSAATEAMLRRDLELSGTLSMALASLVFVLTFRRVRALAAVLPPLVLGTVWTAGMAAALPGGLSAIAVAFTSVVVGVGVDTGVHVYAALLDARRRGLPPREAAAAARNKTARAVLTAAVTAAAAFGALALSEIGAVRQLGILCAAGEVLTAIAIVLVTPEIGALLERGAAPPDKPARWTSAVSWLTGSRARAAVTATLALLPIPLLFALGPPPFAEAMVALRPQKLAPLVLQERIYEAFGGQRGQWVVLVSDPDLEHGRERIDRLTESLKKVDSIVSVDSLTTLAPAHATQEARFAARDALDLSKKAGDLERALREVGFAPDRFAGALASMRAPTRAFASLDDLQKGPAGVLANRYVGRDEGAPLLALYLTAREGSNAEHAVQATLARVDPAAQLTGYSRLDPALKASLGRDLPRIGAAAAVLVLGSLLVSLRRPRDVALAGLVVAAEIAVVLLLIRALSIPMHAFSALVLPVLLGITVDEGMFLLHHARHLEAAPGDPIAATIAEEGPPVAATALTTAAGFAALLVCDFEGMRHLGAVGALGSATGLVVALVVVPAGLRLTRRKTPPSS